MMARDRSPLIGSSSRVAKDGALLAREVCDEIGVAWMIAYALILIGCVIAILGGSFALATSLPPVASPAACAIPVRL